MNSPTSSGSQSRRKSSLRLAQPPQIPVPPSLRASPYLNCPVFKQDITSPRLPTEEEERWLQDTVPADARPSSAAPTLGTSASQNRIPGLTRHSTFPTSHLTPPPAHSMCATTSAHQRPRSGTVKQRVRSGAESTTNQSAGSASPSDSETLRIDGYNVPTLLGTPSIQVTPDGLGWSTMSSLRSSSSGSRTPSDQFTRLGLGDQGYFRETSYR